MSWEHRYPTERLVPYDPDWARRYVELTEPLVAALGPGWAFEHVGSTSVPGLTAKPVIDIAVAPAPRCHRTDIVTTLRKLGWSDPVEVGGHEATFALDGTVRVAIGHVFTREQWPSAHVRLFAQWLRLHDSDRDDYARLKTGLLSEGVWGAGYTHRKREFVVRVVNQARVSQGWPAVASL